ncbi:MAG: tyrosine-type recombinase/integrase [Acidobacteria bacterium]|nr:tyrosine-type recombinase/integrase [Acidobacteriota bacterium]
MPTIKFQPTTARSLKANPAARVEYFDLDQPGLALRVTAAGVKTWTVLYRHRGRLRRLTIGSLKAIGLAEARTRARTAISAASDGADPAAAKQDARRVETIADLAADYIEKHARRKKKSWREDDRMLRADILPAWKSRAVADITRRDVRQLVEAIAERGAPIGANRTAALLSKLFRYAEDAEIIERSPAIRIPRPGVAKSRDRVLTEDEIRQLWQTFDGLDAPMAAFYKLRLITAQRGNEVASMRWTDVDLDAGWWTIPGTVAKNKLPHRVPWSSTALALVEGLDPGTDERAVYVLDGARGRRQQSEAAATFPVKDFRGHDLRRTAASLMAGGGVPRLTISKILNHVETSITAVYDRHSYDAEKRAALDWWALKLAAILDNRKGTVLAFSRGA